MSHLPDQSHQQPMDRESLERPDQPSSFLPQERHELELLEHYSREGQNPAIIRELLPKMKMVVVEGESIQGFFIQKKPMQLCPMVAVATSRRLFFYKRKLLGGAEMEEYAWQWLGSPQIEHHALSSTIIIKFRPPSGVGVTLTIDWLPRPQAQRLFHLAADINNFWSDENRIRKLQMERAKSGGWMGTMDIREIAKPSLPNWKQFDPAKEEARQKRPLQLEAGESFSAKAALPAPELSQTSLQQSLNPDSTLIPYSSSTPATAQPSTPVVWQEIESISEKETAPADWMAYLKELKDLLDQGLISQEEYDQKKAEILAKL